MKITTQNFKLAAAGILAISTMTGIFAPQTASAALVTGNASITIDNSAVTASNPSNWFFETHWGPGDSTLAIDGSTTGGTALATTGSSALFAPVNTNATTIAYPSAGAYGRTVQATTMDAGNTSIGQIGLSGALRMRDSSLSTYLAPYDFSLVKTGSDWVIRSFDNAFSYANLFKLTNVSESLNGSGELSLSGDLLWATGGVSWSALLGADTSAVVGTFNLAPSAVPVPAAVWLFGTGLLGLLGMSRRKSTLSA